MFIDIRSNLNSNNKQGFSLLLQWYIKISKTMIRQLFDNMSFKITHKKRKKKNHSDLISFMCSAPL